ncbi:MAG: ATP phosphoribosyltransferase regulatory subunit [Clostridia bacterium]|nr:ATP phosphoribosyltransferase regulatory subunit [Clostridia bacterium]
MINESLLKPEERAIYALRSLYSSYGYTPYKMSKFEEYDLYVKNKDSLISEGIITFTDTRGRLLALKPDVTLSIIKNSKDIGDGVYKVYYNESVYRIGKDSHTFKEIMQTGLECIGSLDAYQVAEVVVLALDSLATLGGEYMLDLAHVGLVDALFAAQGIDGETRERILDAISKKNMAELDALVRDKALGADAAALAVALSAEYDSFADASASLSAYATTAEAMDALSSFGELCATLSALGYAQKIRIDFSVINPTSYYSGVVFKGYIKGIPDGVLAGGQYDRMMRRMGRADGAVGFAVYMDALARYGEEVPAYDTDILLLKNGAAPADVLRAVAALSKGGVRVTALCEKAPAIRYKSLYKMQGKEAILCGND